MEWSTIFTISVLSLAGIWALRKLRIISMILKVFIVAIIFTVPMLAEDITVDQPKPIVFPQELPGATQCMNVWIDQVLGWQDYEEVLNLSMNQTELIA